MYYEYTRRESNSVSPSNQLELLCWDELILLSSVFELKDVYKWVLNQSVNNLIHLLWLALLTVYAKLLITNVFSDHLDESLIIIIVITVRVVFCKLLIRMIKQLHFSLRKPQLLSEVKSKLNIAWIMLPGLWLECRSFYFLAIHCCNFGYCCCNRYWWCFFFPKKYTFNLQTNVWTTYSDVNFNENFEALVFQKSYTQYLYSTLTHLPINRC